MSGPTLIRPRLSSRETPFFALERDADVDEASVPATPRSPASFLCLRCGAALHQALIEALPPCPPRPEGIGVGRVWLTATPRPRNTS